MIKRALLAAAAVGLVSLAAACTPPPPTAVKLSAPVPTCRPGDGVHVTFIEDQKQPCAPRHPQVLSIRMSPVGDIRGRCTGMGGTMDLYADLLCVNVDY